MQAQRRRRVRRTTSVLESEEAERKRRWGHFLSTRATQAPAAARDPAAQQAAALQQLSVWLQEHREEPNALTEERCTQVRTCSCPSDAAPSARLSINLAGISAVCESFVHFKAGPAPHVQLRMLVQAGVPAALRRDVWSLFLGLPVRSRGGLYGVLLRTCFGDAAADALAPEDLSQPPSPKATSPRAAGASSPAGARREPFRAADEVRQGSALQTRKRHGTADKPRACRPRRFSHL